MLIYGGIVKIPVPVFLTTEEFLWLICLDADTKKGAAEILKRWAPERME